MASSTTPMTKGARPVLVAVASNSWREPTCTSRVTPTVGPLLWMRSSTRWPFSDGGSATRCQDMLSMRSWPAGFSFPLA
ncbi:hypothetical protein [Pyxidicoccus parkwayensis]|uniref:hypothetical protein n=1 Tax=Pyxidicoccus parkwayensis TaxID=2813578 RepID=UPI001F50CDA7|nr:hypothetical protein [Pyxidicoccus parkwaysis]